MCGCCSFLCCYFAQPFHIVEKCGGTREKGGEVGNTTLLTPRREDTHTHQGPRGRSSVCPTSTLASSFGFLELPMLGKSHILTFYSLKCSGLFLGCWVYVACRLRSSSRALCCPTHHLRNIPNPMLQFSVAFSHHHQTFTCFVNWWTEGQRWRKGIAQRFCTWLG